MQQQSAGVVDEHGRVVGVFGAEGSHGAVFGVELGEGGPDGSTVVPGEGLDVLGGEVVFGHAVKEVSDFVAEAAGGQGFAEGVGPGGAGCDAFGVVGEQFADDDVLLGAGEELEVAFDAGEEPAGLGSFEQVEGVGGPGAGGGYGEAAVAGGGDGVSHAGRGGAGGCEDEQAGGVVAVGEVAQGALGEVVGFTGSGDAGEKLGCHGFSLSGGRRVRPAARSFPNLFIPLRFQYIKFYSNKFVFLQHHQKTYVPIQVSQIYLECFQL